MDSSIKRINELSQQVYDLKVSLEMTQKDVDGLKNTCTDCSKIRADVDIINISLGSVLEKAEYQEDQIKHHNIVVEGVEESVSEKASESEEKVRKIFSDKLQLDHTNIELEWAHRTGKLKTLSEKPIGP